MKVIANRRLFEVAAFDSGALGLLAMVVHQFATPGRYRATVFKDEKPVSDLEFEVSKESAVMQLDIDLAKATRNRANHAAQCECNGKSAQTRVVSPNGYVLFHASSGSGYAVRAGHVTEKTVFDSEMLTEGDIFAVSLLEPGRYSMMNKLGGAKGEIEVTFNKETRQVLRSLETVYVDVGPEEFKPARLSVTSSQGIVFRIRGSGRVQIERRTPSAGSGGKQRPSSP